jgi:hypothetical protein
LEAILKKKRDEKERIRLEEERKIKAKLDKLRGNPFNLHTSRRGPRKSADIGMKFSSTLGKKDL